MAKNGYIDSRELGSSKEWIAEEKAKKANLKTDSNVSVDWADAP